MSDIRMMGELTIAGQKELDCQHNQTRLACIPSHSSSAELLTLLMVSKCDLHFRHELRRRAYRPASPKNDTCEWYQILEQGGELMQMRYDIAQGRHYRKCTVENLGGDRNSCCVNPRKSSRLWDQHPPTTQRYRVAHHDGTLNHRHDWIHLMLNDALLKEMEKPHTDVPVVEREKENVCRLSRILRLW